MIARTRQVRLPRFKLGGTGPGPVFGASGQARGDGVVFNVGADAVELGGIADPVVEGFVLPEVLAGAMEDGVGVAGGYTFQAVGYAGDGNFRSDQNVDVVGHDYVGVKGVEV